MPDQPADGKQHAPPSSSAELGVAASDETWGSPVGYEPQTYERTQPAYISDRRFYRIVVGFLGAVAILAALGTIILAARDLNVPDSLVALGSAAIGALASLVAGGGRQ
ncbi:MAG: hypothetical protein OXF66_03840 [Gammaproteobacteria bacterium]|nr:hypothetical protein [Gammaproteobacteria bacterium]